MDIDALFKGMQSAPVYNRGNWMSEGEYEVAIKSIKAQASTKKRGETFFACEFRVVKVFRTMAPEKNRVDSSGTWLPNFKLQSTFGNIKQLMFAILGVNGADVPETDVDQHELATLLAMAGCGSENGIAGLRQEKFGLGADVEVNDLIAGTHVRLTTVQIKTKEGADYTRHDWAPVPLLVAQA